MKKNVIFLHNKLNDPALKYIKITNHIIENDYDNFFHFTDLINFTNITDLKIYDTIIIQWWAIAPYLINIETHELNNQLFDIIINFLKAIKQNDFKVIFMLYDIHPDTFEKKLRTGKPCYEYDIGYNKLRDILNIFNCKIIIGSYNCKESDIIEKMCIGTKYFFLEHAICDKIFNDFSKNIYEEKIYDVCMIGAIGYSYPLRRKIVESCRRLNSASKIKFKYCSYMPYKKLAHVINKS